jgi:hypothetical protein
MAMRDHRQRLSNTEYGIFISPITELSDMFEDSYENILPNLQV